MRILLSLILIPIGYVLYCILFGGLLSFLSWDFSFFFESVRTFTKIESSEILIIRTLSLIFSIISVVMMSVEMDLQKNYETDEWQENKKII